MSEDQTDWDEWVTYAVYVYNSTVHSTTKFTPFELIYGLKSDMPSALRETPTIQYNYDYVMELKGRLQSSHEIARQRLLSGKERSKEYYDKGSEIPTIQVGQKVLIFDDSEERRSKKLSPQYIGPYDVLVIEGVNVVMKRGRTTQKIHVNRVKPYY